MKSSRALPNPGERIRYTNCFEQEFTALVLRWHVGPQGLRAVLRREDWPSVQFVDLGDEERYPHVEILP
jgi:hypothetical protein